MTMHEIAPLHHMIEASRRGGNLIETHISWVLLTDAFVYKLKKPVDFGFLDFTSLERRRSACDSELLLNRRLAMDVYLDIVPVRSPDPSLSAGALRAYIDDRHWAEQEGRGGSDELIDWAVKMRRLDQDTRADVLLSKGRLRREQVEELAQLLVGFHARCATSEAITAFGRPEAIAKNVQQNFEQTSSFLHEVLTSEQSRLVHEHQLGFLQQHGELFHERAAAGFVRDGHGDLRLEHVYFTPSGIQIIDCIEFSDAFRYGDTGADLAFLVMDLRHQQRGDLAELLLSKYAEYSRDYTFYPLADFYEAYRAFVRGKVYSLQLAQKVESAARDQHLEREARRYFLHAVASQQPSSEPSRLIVVGGLIASGKSTVAAKLGRMLECAVLEADRRRKTDAQVPPDEPVFEAPFTGLYSEQKSEQVYARMLEDAQCVLQSGRSVVLDATYRKKAARRSLIDLAEKIGADVYFVWCEVSRERTSERLAKRALGPSVSDGRAELYEHLVRDCDPPTKEEFPTLLFLDTALPADALEQQLLRLLGRE